MPALQYRRPELEPPEGRDFWTRYGDEVQPTFSVREAALVFFGHTKIWLQRHINDGDHELDGELIPLARNSAGYYRLQLPDIERMAHAFFARAIIDLNRFENCLLIVKAMGSNYRLI